MAAQTVSTTSGSNVWYDGGAPPQVAVGLGTHPNHLGANTTAGGWSTALSRESLTGPLLVRSARPLSGLPFSA